jgi:hypothetical protein
MIDSRKPTDNLTNVALNKELSNGGVQTMNQKTRLKAWMVQIQKWRQK